MSTLLTEAIGTYFLVLVIALSGEPIAIGAILIAMVYMGGAVSGAHYNPAVTIAVLIRGAIKGAAAMRYIIAQCAGAALAGLTYTAVSGSVFFPKPAAATPAWTIILVETLFTFALATVVLNVATSKKTKDNHYFGLAIGLTVMAGAYAAGPISGGVFNPAVALGPAIFQLGTLNTIASHLTLYLIGPAVGGILAGVVYKQLHD